MKSEEEIRRMMAINFTAIKEGILPEIEDSLIKLKENPADGELRKHIISQLLDMSLDSGAIGALKWVLEEER